MAHEREFLCAVRGRIPLPAQLVREIALLENRGAPALLRASAVTTTLLRRLPLLAAVRLPSAPTRWAMSDAKRPRHDDTLGDEMKRYEADVRLRCRRSLDPS